MKIKQFFAGFILLLMVIPVFALGADIEVGEEYSLGKGEVVSDNLYVVSGDISINGRVLGDLTTLGGNIVLSERVSGDFMAAGGSVTILESVAGDARVAGGNILISENIDGDLMVAGGVVQILSDVLVSKDLVVAGGKVTMDGVVRGDVKSSGGLIVINGQVDGDVKAEVGEKIKIGDDALIKGDLIYSGKKDSVLEMGEKATVLGEVIFQEGGLYFPLNRGNAKDSLMAALGAFALFKLLALLVVALIGVVFFKKFSYSVVSHSVGNPGRELLWGIVTLIVLPIVICILFATVIGSALAMITMFLYMIMLVVSAVYSGVIFGAWLHKRLQKREELIVNWENALGGIVLLAIITLIPVIGWIVTFIFFLLALGSISGLIHRKIWIDRK